MLTLVYYCILYWLVKKENIKERGFIMSICELTKKKPVVVNLVSHSNIKTKSHSKPNIQNKQLYSQALKQVFNFNIAISTLRTIEHKGGFDAFILKQPRHLLSKRAAIVQKKIKKKLNQKMSWG